MGEDRDTRKKADKIAGRLKRMAADHGYELSGSDIKEYIDDHARTYDRQYGHLPKPPKQSVEEAVEEKKRIMRGNEPARVKTVTIKAKVPTRELQELDDQSRWV